MNIQDQIDALSAGPYAELVGPSLALKQAAKEWIAKVETAFPGAFDGFTARLNQDEQPAIERTIEGRILEFEFALEGWVGSWQYDPVSRFSSSSEFQASDEIDWFVADLFKWLREGKS